MADLFLSLLTFSGCVIAFHDLQPSCWHVLVIFDYQEVRIYISWAARSWLTCSCHIWLSAGAYSHFMSCTAPSQLNSCSCHFDYQHVRFIFGEKHNHDWLVPATFDCQWVRNPILWAAPSRLTCSCHSRPSASAYLYFAMSEIVADVFLPLFTLSGCVFPSHEVHYHGLYVPAIFDYQEVGIYISGATQSWLTCSCHFLTQWVRNRSSCAAPSRLTCSRRFRLSGSAYLYFMNSIVMADTFLPFWLSVGA